MPYPRPSDANYCPASEQRPSSYDPQLQWQRCPRCGRPIAAKADGRLFPHLDHPTRRNDDIQESLIAAGLNRRRQPVTIRYAEQWEED